MFVVVMPVASMSVARLIFLVGIAHTHCPPTDSD
jgi:hypothetical protein